MHAAGTGVVTLTMNPAVDREFAVDAMEPERKLRPTGSTDSPGGGGINVARALKELGCPVTAVWACGDTMGQHLSDLLDAQGLVHRPVRVDGMSRENLVVLERSTGRQFRFGFPGPRLSDEEAEACLEAFADAMEPGGVAVLSGSLPPGVDDAFYAEAAGRAPRGCRVVLDSSGRAMLRGVEAGVFLVKPNVRELEALAGRRLTDESAMEVSARELVDSARAEVVVVSLGAGGGMLVDADGAVRVPSPAVDAASVVGAGDSMVAGLVAGVVRGYTMRDSLRLGVAAGAAAVACPGTGLCRRVDVDAMFERTRLSDLARPRGAGRGQPTL